jgi:hypothetical protein
VTNPDNLDLEYVILVRTMVVYSRDLPSHLYDLRPQMAFADAVFQRISGVIDHEK